MEQYKIQIFPTAQSDLADIVTYLNTLSQVVALKYYDLIVEKIKGWKTKNEEEGGGKGREKIPENINSYSAQVAF